MTMFEAPRGVFVTGTDTGVGKSFVSACIVHAWQASYYKPIQTGLADEPGDTATIGRLVGTHARAIFPPTYEFDAPLAPLDAARREGREIDVAALTLPEADGPLLVEGAGGAMVPVWDGLMMVDLIVRFGLPVIVVARSGLGTINHTLLTLQALRAAGATVAGVVLNGPPAPHNRRAIEEFGNVRVLAEIPPFPVVDAVAVKHAAASIPSFESVIRGLEAGDQ